MDYILLKLLALLAALLPIGEAFSSRKVPTACDSMQPYHIPLGLFGQFSKSPYVIRISPEEENSYIVTIYSPRRRQQFKGFVLQAQVPHSDKKVGVFSSIDENTQAVDCSRQGGAIQHVNSTPKDRISVKWVPAGYTGRVEFTATVVQSYYVYWTDVTSRIMNIVESH